MTAPSKSFTYVGGAKVDTAWVMRRRWARAGLMYFLLTFFAIVFMGPLLMALVSSLKTDPLEYPPRLIFEQLLPKNWNAAFKLGQQAGGNGWTGGIAPGANISFEASYLVPSSVVPTGKNPELVSVLVPKIRPGAGSNILGNISYAADYAKIENLKVSSLTAATMPDGKPGQRVTYTWNITYPLNAKNVDEPDKPAPRIALTPLTLEAPFDYVYQSATLDPSRLENVQAARGDRTYTYPKIQSYINVSPGALNYTFRNYFRIFEEARDISSGQSLFLAWILNSFLLVFLKCSSGLILAPMAGYALARLNFPYKNAFFVFMLFVMTVPNQVLFISNYLVLRDINLLGSIFGVWLVSPFVAAGQVFLMKQFFETLPRELEEAAKIDGASVSTTFWRVIMPLAGPALGALSITTAQGAWNEYFWPAVALTRGGTSLTLPIGLRSFNQTYGASGDYGLILAGAIVSALPVIILFIVFQRYFVASAASSGGKE